MTTGHERDLSGVVDVHAHVLLTDIEQAVRGLPELLVHQERELASLGPESAAENVRMTMDRLPQLIDVGVRIEAMDAMGVAAQLVSVAPSQYHPWADRARAVDLATQVNEGVAVHCAKAPDHLTGLGVAPLQHPNLMVDALEHAVLGCAHKGVEVSTYAPEPSGSGVIELSDRRLDPFWRRAEELDAVVFVHPFGCTVGTRLDRWYLANSVGQPMEHAIALSHLIFGGVFDRHPDLKVLAAHGGGYLPSYAGRMDHAWAVRQDAHSCLQRPSSYLSRILVDSLVHDPAGLHALVERMGAGNVLLGSDWPFDMADDTPVDTLRAAGLDGEQTRAVAGENARRLGLAPAHRPTPAP